MSRMSSDDDEAFLQKHSEKHGTRLARPLARSTPGETGARRQSRDSQSHLSQGVAGSRQSKYPKPAGKAGAAAPSEADSDNEATLLSKHTNKLLQSQVILHCLLVRKISVSNLTAIVTCRRQPSRKELRKAKAGQLRFSQT